MRARRSTPSTPTGAGPLPPVLLVFFLLYCLVLPSLAGAHPILFRGSAAHHAHARRAAVDGTYNITGQPNANGSAAVSVYGDGDPAVEYSSGWSVRTSTSLNLTDGMEHVTTTHGSSATFSFRGTAIMLIGTTGPNHGTFTVRLDGNLHKGLSSKSAHPLVGQALFHAGGLADGQSHRFVLTHADDKGVELDVDAFVVWNDAASPTPSPAPVTATTLACGSSATARGHSYALSVSDSGGIGFPACPTGLTATSLASESIVGGGSSSLSRRVSSLQSNIPTSPPGGLGAANAKHKTELTVGAVLGSLAGLALLVGAFWLVYSRRKTDGEADGRRRPSIFGGRAPSHDLTPTSSNSESTPATHGSNGTRSTGVMIETLTDGPAPAVAGALAARPHIQHMPERSFEVTRSVRIQAPITPVALSRGLFGRPQTGESALSIDTGTSHTHPDPSKNYGTITARPTTGSSDRHPSGSGSSNDHSGGGRSPGPRAFDPYLSRRSSVLSVRNPDLELDTPSAEEIADPFQNEVSSPDGSPWEYDRRSLYSTSSPPVPFPNGGMPLPPEPVAPLPVLPGPGGFPFRRRVSTIGEVDEPTAYATPSDILPPRRSRGPFAGGTPSPRSTPEGGSGAGSLRGTPAGGSGAGSLAARPSNDTGSYTPWDVQDVSFSAFPFNVPAVPQASSSRRQPPPGD